LIPVALFLAPDELRDEGAPQIFEVKKFYWVTIFAFGSFLWDEVAYFEPRPIPVADR
jgi:hypothetical protein